MITTEMLTTDVPTALTSLRVAGVVDVTFTNGYYMVKMKNLRALRDIVEALTGAKQVLKQEKDHDRHWIQWSYVVGDTTYYFGCTMAIKEHKVYEVEG